MTAAEARREGRRGKLASARAVWHAQMAMLPSRALLLGIAGALGVAAAFTITGAADAKSTWESPWSLEQTYNGATRLVRVDLGLKITEKDPQAAYLLFEYRNVESGKRATPGSIELTPSANGAVKVVVQLSDMPHYHEQVLVDRLAKKMREEYGEPPPRPKPRPAPSHN